MPKNYSKEDLLAAISDVKSKGLSIRKSASDHGVPRKTLEDHVKGRVQMKPPGPAFQLTPEEESSLVNYMQYMSQQGFPMTRDIVRKFISTIVRKSGRKTLFNLESGPSNKWFRKFCKRHPEITEKKPERQDRSRNRMANQTVMDQYFSLLKTTMEDLKIYDKPERVFNCDETGWSGKEASSQKVFGAKGQHSYQQSVVCGSHITAHLCISASGRVLPTFLIFEKSLPHRNFKDGVPGDWLYGSSDSGYMDSQLFQLWFENIFIPNCGSQRPVLLVLDNHDSHINIDIIELARANQISLLGLPPHTTHILQPLDVSVNGPLKRKFSSLSLKLGYANKHSVIGKAQFPVVLSYSIDQVCSPALIKESFRKSGIAPLNPDAIDKTQLTPSHVSSSKPTSSQPTNDPQPSCSGTTGTCTTHTKSICTACGSYLGTNPLVLEGLIPEQLSDIFLPMPAKPYTAKRKTVTEARVITGNAMLEGLKQREDLEKKRKEEIAQRKQDREERKRKKEHEKEEAKQRRLAKDKSKTGKKTKPYLCGICGKADPVVTGTTEETNWIQCEDCQDWFHQACADVCEEEVVSDEFCFLCCFCE